MHFRSLVLLKCANAILYYMDTLKKWVLRPQLLCWAPKQQKHSRKKTYWVKIFIQQNFLNEFPKIPRNEVREKSDDLWIINLIYYFLIPVKQHKTNQRECYLSGILIWNQISVSCEHRYDVSTFTVNNACACCLLGLITQRSGFTLVCLCRCDFLKEYAVSLFSVCSVESMFWWSDKILSLVLYWLQLFK